MATAFTRLANVSRYASAVRSRVSVAPFTTRCLSSGGGKDTTDHVQSRFKNPIVQQLWNTRQAAKAGLNATDDGKALPSENKPKTPAGSHVEITYEFSTDQLLYENYKNPWDQMRLGKMMEDLDALAGNIAFFHVDQGQGASEHPTIVTASVDRIRLRERPHIQNDQVLQGQVTWTGTSSMEIRMSCTDKGTNEEWLESYVTFVTLDPATKRPTKVPPIEPQTPEEVSYFEQGAKRAQLKKARRKESKAPEPSLGTESVAASLLEEAGPLINMPSLANPHAILMEATKMQNAMIAQPQAQNLHNAIFGGFLMRRAFELAFANAYVFGGSLPIFLEVDDVSFNQPVNSGDLLIFSSRVLYTDHGRLGDFYSNVKDHRELPLAHIEVEAWVTEPEHVTSRRSNSFSFTFAIDTPLVRRVLPGNVDEAKRMAKRMQLDRDQQQNDSCNI